MIISAYSEETKKYGAVDNRNRDIIVPCNYSEVQIQPNGIVVKDTPDYGCYTLLGKLIYSPKSATKITNIVFLEGNLFIFSIPKKQKVVVCSLDGHFIIPPIFESILFFCGVNFKATEFSFNTDITETLKTNLFFSTGASVPAKLCVKSNNLWGVYDTNAGEFLCSCSYPAITQYKNGPITVFDSKGGSFQIS